MDTLAIIEVVTYICAVLGGVLLFLCIILAAFFIYFQCRKLQTSLQGGNRQYVIVPRGDNNVTPSMVENGHAGMKDPIPVAQPLVTLTAENLVSAGQSRPNTLPINTAPIKKKLLWRKKKRKSNDRLGRGDESDALFTPEDFEEARRVEPLFKKKRRRGEGLTGVEGKFRRRSKSEWDLSDYPNLPPGQSPINPELSFFGRDCLASSGSNSEDVGKSQYFDALDTIGEEDEEADQPQERRASEQLEQLKQRVALQKKTALEEQGPDSLWEDLPALEGIPEETSLQLRRFISHSKALKRRRIAMENPQLRRRIRAMKVLIAQQRTVEQQFYAELSQIEQRYRAGRFGQLQDMRRKLIQGENAEEVDPGFFGVPYYWLHAMLQCDTLRSIIQEHDKEVLKYLTDIRVVPRTAYVNGGVVHRKESASPGQTELLSPSSCPHDFVLEFHFAENAFFSDKVLTKEYEVECGDPHDLGHFSGPEIVACRGCRIKWTRGNNVTLRPVRKRDRATGSVMQKWAKRNSFFNFFNPPTLQQGRKPSVQDERKASLLEAHFEIGLHFKETFVPKATYFFLSEEEHGIRLPERSQREIRKGSVAPARLSSREENSQNVPVLNCSSLDTTIDESVMTTNSQVTLGQIMSSKGTDITSADADSHEHSDMAMRSDSPTPQPQDNGGLLQLSGSSSRQADPMIGRFRLESSENFDEFMKALGVGMVKRKMANSVTPVNIIKVNPSGLYTIRTETTLRTSEIHFRLNEFFSEPTLDGRVTQTLPTRTGNVLVLYQKGDNSKGEKDSQMIRDVQGDTMYMELKVDDVVCKRIYKRITE